MSLFYGLDACYCMDVVVTDEERESVGQFQCFILDGL